MLYLLPNTPNPDSASIAAREFIQIPLSFFDISASGYFGKIQTNYIGTTQTIFLSGVYSQLEISVPRAVENSGSYYTPIYREKINYNEWLTRINRNFEELE